MFRSPLATPFKPLKYDKFGVIRPNVPAPFNKIPHSGVDLRPHETGGGRGVFAIADGVVTKSTNADGSYIQIDHGDPYIAIYVHLAKKNFREGQKVKKGEMIGSYNTGPSGHLHFTLIKDGKKVDPEKYINFNYSTEPKLPSQNEIAMQALRNDYIGNFKEDHVNRINSGQWAYSYTDFVKSDAKRKEAEQKLSQALTRETALRKIIDQLGAVKGLTIRPGETHGEFGARLMKLL